MTATTFICIIIAIAVGTIIVNVLVSFQKSKLEKQFFNKECLEKYESNISNYLRENSINSSDTIEEICSKLGYKVEECESLPNKAEANIEENKTIRILKELSLPEKNFDTAHEIAHIIRGGSGVMSRTRHSLKSRSAEEQICDYYAAALLLPLEQTSNLMKREKYDEMSKKEKLQFISLIAAKKDLSEEVVVRRIIEIRKIYK